MSAVDKDYPFVEESSDDFFCPVTMGLLLQPHLTSCCGKHLSHEASTRIQREGGACPLCKKQSWNTVLNKYFQRQVNSQRVFCRHEDKGCGWEGELAAFHNHVECCPMRDGILITDVVKLPGKSVTQVLLVVGICSSYRYNETVSGASPHQITTSGLLVWTSHTMVIYKYQHCHKGLFWV